MTFSNKSHYILMLMISSILILFALPLDVSNAAAEGSTLGFGTDGFFPLAPKHVTIRNIVSNRATLNLHCKSSETDFGLIHLPWGHTWDFRFNVNFRKTTKFVCHFTWSGGGSHYFTIFKVSRDDNPLGDYPVCRECFWEVGRYGINPMCRINGDKSEPYCFHWDNINI